MKVVVIKIRHHFCKVSVHNIVDITQAKSIQDDDSSINKIRLLPVGSEGASRLPILTSMMAGSHT
jgi:hypothetical protein